MVRFRLYYNKERETAFLNEMSQKGYAMTGFCAGLFTFDRCEPGEYIYQIDITQGFFRVSDEYREFMREMDVEIVCLWGPWVILRKKAAEGPFVMYTDVESTIQQYTKIQRLFKGAAIAEIMAMLVEIVCAIQGSSLALVFFFLLAAICAAMIRELIRVKGILVELKSRQGLEPEEKDSDGKKNLSGLIALGFLFNAFGLLLQETGPDGEFLKGFFQGLAIVCFLAGAVHTLWKRK